MAICKEVARKNKANPVKINKVVLEKKPPEMTEEEGRTAFVTEDFGKERPQKLSLLYN